ncbi:MAG: ECF transporter S component [Candidatus Lokiarchaeota archaeon]|nr:ECF transporter S component [Candidatus Lokiarchaeota archaeon]
MTETRNTLEMGIFNGYYLNVIVLSTAAIFAAFTCILTFIVPFTIPTTGGYINLGDIGVMISGLLFGPIIGGLAGGIGSAFTDLFLAPQYAIPTFIIKGLEGFIVGLIANPKRFYSKFNFRDVLAVIIGGLFMVFGYFLTEILLYGFPSALFELFFNGAIQFGLGALVASIFTIFSRKNIISALPQVFDKIFIYEAVNTNSK